VFFKVTANDVDIYHSWANCQVTRNHPNDSVVMLKCVVFLVVLRTINFYHKAYLITLFKWNRNVRVLLWSRLVLENVMTLGINILLSEVTGFVLR
jgi:hypothetical protein